MDNFIRGIRILSMLCKMLHILAGKISFAFRLIQAIAIYLALILLSMISSDFLLLKGMFKIVFYISLIVILGCRGENDDSVIPEIDIENNIGNFEKLQLSDYISDIRYIPLENKPALFRRIFQMDFYKDMIAVRDVDHCVLYDSEGRFISKIGNPGKGPGETLSVQT